MIGNNADTSAESISLGGVTVASSGQGNNGVWTSAPGFVGKTISTSTPLTYTNTNGGQGLWLYAIEVNGVILVDSPSSQIDSLVDVPTNYGTDTGVGGEVRGNYATLLDQYVTDKTRLTMANGNLDVTFNNSGSSSSALSSIGVSSGKWYAEFTCTQTGSYYAFVGIASTSISNIDSLGYGDTYAYLNNSGNKMSNGSSVAYGATWTAGDVIGVALDLTAGTLTFYKNGTSQGQAYSSISGTYIIGCSGFQSWKFSANFGQRPFAYAAPSGFKALNTANLPAPVVTKPDQVFQAKTYQGTGSTQSITGLAFSPDFVWIKDRSAGNYHTLQDVVRGATKDLYSNTTDAEGTQANSLNAFNSNGFTVGTAGWVNTNNNAYISWCWDAGTTTVSNTQGSITSQVRANASAGFSIVTYTGNATAGATVGHGLGSPLGLYIIKNRDAVQPWIVLGSAIDTTGANGVLILNSTAARTTSATTTATNSTTFPLSQYADVNGSGQKHVAYCFAPVSGYSSFGSYVGNGSSDGPMITTMFRPRWIMIKPLYQYDGGGATLASTAWYIYDSARGTYNGNGAILGANNSYAEENNATDIDFLSNGFKLRNSRAVNTSSGAIYAAFAEAPFNYARAR
jgi:hypothetical protein